MSSKMRNTKNNKMQDGKFKKKNIKHDPQAESARAVFGEPKAKEYDPTDFKI
ncbi:MULTISPECIES: CPC_1213 family protein [Clostridium]|nr:MULTISPECIES: CPC_1213 family protein [Clostridium]